MKTLSLPNKQFDGLIFIGRFQPFHNGHLEVVKKASRMAETVLIIIGSADVSPNVRNPFTYDERVEMISMALKKEGITNCQFAPQNDVPYNDTIWVRNLQSTVSYFFHEGGEKIGLIGHSKDESSYYLKLFPEYSSVEVDGLDQNGKIINSTDIRNIYFKSYESFQFEPEFTKEVHEKRIKEYLQGLVPKNVREWMSLYYINTETYKKLCSEFEFVQDYKKQWASVPYPVIFNTVDAVCIQGGHVLLITRGAQPGKGKLALPGGFLENMEKIQDGIIRELIEETMIDIPPAVLKSKMEPFKVFDYPYRSSRGRTITFAALFNLDSELDRREIKQVGSTTKPLGFTKVKGSDDADKAGWYKISDLKKKNMFSDHYDIIMTLIGDVS